MTEASQMLENRIIFNSIESYPTFMESYWDLICAPTSFTSHMRSKVPNTVLNKIVSVIWTVHSV